MAKFLNTSKAYAEIEDIINKANSKLILISPYIKIPELLLERLKYADKKNVKITVVCRKDDLKADARSELKQLKNLELRFDKDLHAKCFYNEESMVITSLNLYEHSQQHNREMGILLSLKDDCDIFNEACTEAEYIVGRAEKDSLLRGVLSGVVKEAKSIVGSAAKDDFKRTKTTSRTEQKGHCLRCGKSIAYDLDRPLCRDCFSEWRIYENPDYTEHYCHNCGKPVLTTIEMPLCGSCYRSRR